MPTEFMVFQDLISVLTQLLGEKMPPAHLD